MKMNSKYFASSIAAIPNVALEPIVDQTFIFLALISIKFIILLILEGLFHKEILLKPNDANHYYFPKKRNLYL